MMKQQGERDLEARLGTAFRDPALVQQALVHRSFVHERPAEAPESNERLEYLGDAVAGLVIAQELYRRFPDYVEGRLTELRAGLVRSETMADIAAGLGLGDCLYLGRGEERSGGRKRRRNLAGGLEAVIGALFLDQGFEAARQLTLRLFAGALGALPQEAARDDKSALQEEVQAQGLPPPVYRTVGAQGPDHAKQFTVEVVIGGAVAAAGRGSSLRAAQQEAARRALARRAGKESDDAG